MYRIPHLKQLPKSSTCAAVCTQMTLAALGQKVELQELIEALNTRKGKGTFSTNVASYLSKIGFDVVYTYQPYRLPARYVLGIATRAQTRDYFKRKKLVRCVEMYDNGVEVINHYVSVQYIDKMIKKGYIPIVGARPKILASSKKNGYKGGHAIIVKRVDIKRGRVHVIDPSPHKNTKKSYTIDHFESARVGHNNVVFVRNKK